MHKTAVLFGLALFYALLNASLAVENIDNPWDEFAVFMADDRETSSEPSATLVRRSFSLDWPPESVEIAGVESPSKSLNGDWQVRAGIPRNFDGAIDFGSPEWVTVGVPCDYRMHSVDGARVAMTRVFDVPADWKGGRVKLRCHEIAAAADIWINGQYVGGHMGHFIPFAMDVTKHLKCGDTNRILVVAHKYSLARDMSGYSVHVGGGITRKIELIRVPTFHLSQLHVTTDLDDRYENATLHVTTELANEGAHAIQNANIEFSLIDSEGHRAELESSDGSISLIQPGERVRRSFTVHVHHPQTWNAEQPRLYRLVTTLRTNDHSLQRVERRIGFREIEVRDNQLIVNGRPVKLRGADRHLAHPLRGRSPTPKLARQDAELLKAANCNFVRTSHYPPSEDFIAACDELGLYVEEEAPFCFFSKRRPGVKQADVTRYAVYANLKMVQRDMSHPSVIVWSIGNESKWGPHFEAAATAVARADPSRPRTFMWFNREADSLNVAAEHYPGPDGVTRVDRERPTLFSEYCHLPAYVPHETYTDPGVEDQWGLQLATTWDSLFATPGALGGAIWCGIDDVFHVPPMSVDEEHVVRGVAAWGLLDGWRRPKPEYWHTKKTYSPIRLLTSSIKIPEDGKPVQIPIANRFDFTNLSDLSVRWQCGNESGTLTANVPPRGQGNLTIASSRLTPDAELRLQICDDSNRIVDEYVRHVVSANDKEEQQPVQLTWVLEETYDSITIRSERIAVTFERGTGLIAEALVDGRLVLQGGPHLAFVPTYSKHQQRAMKKEVPGLTPEYGSNWHVEFMEAESKGRMVVVRFGGQYKEADLNGTYEFRPDGEMVLRYQLSLNRNILRTDDLVQAAKPDAEDSQRTLFAFSGFLDDETALVRGKGLNDQPHPTPAGSLAAVPRQLGLRFELPRTMDELVWHREAQWSIYPNDHIGRPRGQARAFLPELHTEEKLGQPPAWPWSSTACPLGTRDFRSTKHNIRCVSLTNTFGQGVQLVSNGTQHSRCYVHDGRVHWLIIDLDNGPSETFMAGYFDPKRQGIPLNKPVEGAIRLRFLETD